jgi:large subunit ribosomal protein L27
VAPGAMPANSLRQGFQYRESNWSIGRIAERKGVQVVPFDKGNRWSRWRRAVTKKKRAREMQKIKKNTKNTKKGNKKKKQGN